MIAAATLADRFAAIRRENADRVAVQTRGATWTYRELGSHVDAVGEQLELLPPRAPVAVRCDGSIESVARLLAVMLSRHPAVPIDNVLPTERIGAMITAVGAVSPFAPEDHRPAAAAIWEQLPPDCAVIAFTSGSTGEPKAVLQPHSLWFNQIDELADELGIGPGHRACQALPISYGAGLDVTLTALMTGATLALPDPRTDGVATTLRALTRWAPDSLHLTPALWRTLCAATQAPQALRSIGTIATCGEAVHVADVAEARTLLPSATFVNRSGSSETGNLAFNVFPPSRPLPSSLVTAGRPARHKAIVIVDDSGTPLPAGEIGHLEVTSPHIAVGYLVDGRVHRFAETAGGRRKILGDRGRLTGGDLHLLGRTDDTIKVRGYRVDTGEITAAVRSVDGIVDAFVDIRDVAGTACVAAYLVAASGHRPPSVAQIRATLATALPGWMQPTSITLVPELPVTERGKIDRAALPDPVGRPDRVAPATRTQRLLAPIWEDLLVVDDIGVTDDLVALGADSLVTVELIRRIHDTFGIELAPSEVFACGTLGGLARMIDAAGSADTVGDVVELSPPATQEPPTSGRGRLVFAFAGAGEAALAMTPLARRLAGVRVVGLQAHGLESRGLPDWTIARAARRCVRHITAIDPVGPYVFVGHSLGGVIAMETARILRSRGRHVEHIVCLDTILDGPLRHRSAIPLSDGEIGRTVGDEDRSTSRMTVWRTRAALLTAGWWRRPAEAQWALFHELGRRSAILHRLRRYDGDLTAVLAEDNPDRTEWWYQLAPSCAAVHHVSGDHNGMLRVPHVDATAAIVRHVMPEVAV